MRVRLLTSLTQDAELWSKARSEVLQDQTFHHALINMSKDCSPHGKSFSIEDNKEVHPSFQQLLQHVGSDPMNSPSLAVLSRLCWSCAELRIHGKEAKSLLQWVVEAMKSELSEDGDELSLLRLAWSSLALGCLDEPLLTVIKIASGESLMKKLSPCDLRPLQQLAWHGLQHHGSAGPWSAAILEVGPQLPRTTSRDGTPGQTDAEKMLSSLLQNLRVPHVVASSQAVPGNIYRLPLWFPHANAVLELNTSSDRLVSGKLSGTAEMRRKQLREAGLKVHSFDMSVLRKATHLQQLCAVAETIASSCPEAQSWLDSEIPQAMQTAAAPQLTERTQFSLMPQVPCQPAPTRANRQSGNFAMWLWQVVTKPAEPIAEETKPVSQRERAKNIRRNSKVGMRQVEVPARHEVQLWQEEVKAKSRPSSALSRGTIRGSPLAYDASEHRGFTSSVEGKQLALEAGPGQRPLSRSSSKPSVRPSRP
eukprot:symbB.v1.2.000729.t1/scaffold36.1/size400579/1